MQIKYIADLHLYDIDSLDWRPNIGDLDQYAILLLDEWNAFTEPDDIIIIVGDIGHFCPRTVEVLKRLKGMKVLIKGNHDIIWGSELYSCGVFKGIYDNLVDTDLYVAHIPDNLPQQYKYRIHGHHHRYDMPGMNKVLKQYVADTYRYNCAADLIGNRPRTLQELATQKEILIERYMDRGLI